MLFLFHNIVTEDYICILARQGLREIVNMQHFAAVTLLFASLAVLALTSAVVAPSQGPSSGRSKAWTVEVQTFSSKFHTLAASLYCLPANDLLCAQISLPKNCTANTQTTGYALQSCKLPCEVNGETSHLWADCNL